MDFSKLIYFLCSYDFFEIFIEDDNFVIPTRMIHLQDDNGNLYFQLPEITYLVEDISEYFVINDGCMMWDKDNVPVKLYGKQKRD